MLPEEKARIKIDKQLSDAGWNIAARDEYVLKRAAVVKGAFMQGNSERRLFVFLSMTKRLWS